MNHAGALHSGCRRRCSTRPAAMRPGPWRATLSRCSSCLQLLSSAKGDRSEARARVTKAGKAQLFAAAELMAWRDGAEVLAASASAVLAKVG